MNGISKIIILPFVIGFLLIMSMVYTLDETQKAVVLQFQRPLYEITEAGLHFKAPWPYQSVKKLEKRLFIYDATSPREIITEDKKSMVVDTFALLKINKGIVFLQRLQTESQGLARAEDIIYSEMRNRLGSETFEEILTTNRNEIMEDVTEFTKQQLEGYGLTTTLVRMNKTELPQQNEESVYNRMRAERTRIAKKYRSEGDEEAQKIRAATDKEVTIILAHAYRTAQENRGAGDARAAQTYAEAYSRDPEFFRLYRGLETTKEVLTNGKEVRVIFDGTEPHLRELFETK